MKSGCLSACSEHKRPPCTSPKLQEQMVATDLKQGYHHGESHASLCKDVQIDSPYM